MKMVPLNSLAMVTAGQSAPKPDEFSNAGIPFVRAGSLDGLLSGMRETSLERIALDTAKKRKLKIYPKGSILFAKSGMSATKDRIYVLQENAYIVSHLAVLIPNEDVSSEYIKHALRRFPPSSLIKDPAYPAISLGEIEEFSIPTPKEFDDQKRIAHLLDTVDGLIAERKMHLQQLDALLQSVFMKMFGDPVRNEKGWNKPPLNKFGRLSTGNTPPRNDEKNYSPAYIEWIKTDNILVNFPFVTRSSEYLSEYGSKNARVVTDGALMVACIAGSIDSIGRAALTDRKVAFNQQINAIQPYDDVNSFFLYSLFKICKPYIQSFAAKGMKKILTKGVFEKIPMIKPPHDLQNKFATIAEKVEGIKQHYQHSLTQLENLYGVLSQKAFKGELDLSRVPMPVEVVESISYDNILQTREIDLEAIANLGYSAAQYVYKAAQAIAPLLVPLVAVIYGFQTGLRDAQSTSVAPQRALELSPHVKLPTVSEKQTLGATEAKRELHAIFTTFIKELGGVPFSTQDFLDALTQELEDTVDDMEQAQRITPQLYEEVKSWIFDSLVTGKLQQAFDDEKDNAVYLRAGEEL